MGAIHRKDVRASVRAALKAGLSPNADFPDLTWHSTVLGERWDSLTEEDLATTSAKVRLIDWHLRAMGVRTRVGAS